MTSAALHAREAADARVAALELLHREAVADLARPGAAVALEVAAEQAELRDLGDELGREGARSRSGRR